MTIHYDNYLRSRVGLPTTPARSRHDRRPREQALRLRRAAVGLHDSVDRRERALWRGARDAVVGHARPVPPERPHVPADARRRRKEGRAVHQEERPRAARGRRLQGRRCTWPYWAFASNHGVLAPESRSRRSTESCSPTAAPREQALRLRGAAVGLHDSWWIAENELSGAGLETPWSDTNAQYRQNVLTYLQTLAARGARPFLLINSAPYTGGEAAAWWQQVAAVADIVREGLFQRQADPRARPDRRQPDDPREHPLVGRPLPRDRHPAEPCRAVRPVSSTPSNGRPRGSRAGAVVVRGREVAGARREAGRSGTAHLDDLVVGLDVVHGQQGPGFRQGRVRLALGAFVGALQRPGCGRPRAGTDR